MKSAFSALADRTPPPPISWLMKMALERPKLISLAAGFTDDVTLPVEETREVLEKLFQGAGKFRGLLQYGSTAGDPRLRQLTADRLRRQEPATRSSSAISPECVLITHGSQQLLYILTECLCDPGDIVLVEDPTYFVYLSMAQSHGLLARGVRLTEDGLDLADLERVLESLKRAGDLRRLKLLYLVSYFQNPSGVTTSFAKKQGALALLRRYEKAAGHPIYLLEDAAYRDLRFSGEDMPSALAAQGGPERVLYAGTYTKPFATGIRVGFGVLPPEVFEAAARVKGNHDFGTAHLLQGLLAEALASGRFDEHLPRLQQRYARKAAVMVSALREHASETAQWLEPRGGLYVWARWPKSMKTGPKSKLFQAALARDVLYVPGEFCYADDPTRPKPRNEMRLSFGNASESEIRESIARLGSVVKRNLR